MLFADYKKLLEFYNESTFNAAATSLNVFNNHQNTYQFWQWCYLILGISKKFPEKLLALDSQISYPKEQVELIHRYNQYRNFFFKIEDNLHHYLKQIVKNYDLS